MCSSLEGCLRSLGESAIDSLSDTSRSASWEASPNVKRQSRAVLGAAVDEHRRTRYTSEYVSKGSRQRITGIWRAVIGEGGRRSAWRSIAWSTCGDSVMIPQPPRDRSPRADLLLCPPLMPGPAQIGPTSALPVFIERCHLPQRSVATGLVQLTVVRGLRVEPASRALRLRLRHAIPRCGGGSPSK